MQQDVECQVFNIGIEDDLDIDGVMHQIQSSGKIEEFTEYYQEVWGKKEGGSANNQSAPPCEKRKG